jgi:hypothetical protein
LTSASSARVAGSFRDPSGFAFRRNGLVHRQVNAAYRATYDALVEARFYDEAIEAGLLVSHRELAADEIEPDGPPTRFCCLSSSRSSPIRTGGASGSSRRPRCSPCSSSASPSSAASG